MKKYLAGFIFWLVVFAMVGMAHALTKPVDYIYDSTTELTWLHHTVTSGMSYDHVVANLLDTGQEFEGWRYASGEETSNLLINNFGFSPGYNLGHRTQADVDRISSLTEMFGDIVKFDDIESSGILGGTGEFSAPPQANYLSVMGSYWFGADNYYSIMSVGNWTISSSNAQSYYSHCLVKDGEQAPIPEPATILLFCTGFAGLAGARLRRKKKK